MTKNRSELTLSQWKERAKNYLNVVMAEAMRRELLKGNAVKTTRRKYISRDKLKLVFDPVTCTVEDAYGGVLTCTYDIGRTLVGLSREFQKMEVTEDEIVNYAKDDETEIDTAMAKFAFRHEAEMFSRSKAGRFLHEQLQPALKELLVQLVDEAYLTGVREYGIELVQPAKTFEQIGRKHIAHIKRRSGLVPAPGRPPIRTKDDLLNEVRVIMSKQKQMSTLPRVAEAMNYGGLRGGGSALGKLLKHHGISWKQLKREWIEAKKRK